ncbi:hypothetical protein DYH09_29415 [bacterium CPR1]|nr:hypothetical protein [bacterium CPR1]
MSDRLWMFADETGQDTGGTLFLVALVGVSQEGRQDLTDRFLDLENASGRTGRKWTRSDNRSREAFLEELPGLAELGRFFWRSWGPGKDYERRVAQTVADAAESYPEPRAVLTPIIDGLDPKSRPTIAALLRSRGIRYRSIRVGTRDESEPLLRLADSLAGFLRDLHTGQKYSEPASTRAEAMLERLA